MSDQTLSSTHFQWLLKPWTSAQTWLWQDTHYYIFEALLLTSLMKIVPKYSKEVLSGDSSYGEIPGKKAFDKS